MSDKNNKVQVIWGIALMLMGIMVLFRIPQVMPRIKQIESFSTSIGFIRFCFYFMAVMLIAGGGKKLYRYMINPSRDPEPADK